MSAPLTGVGYWQPDARRDFPHPKSLIREPYPTELCEQICQYLSSGKTIMCWYGSSYCRFGCDVPSSDLGSSDLSDGVWVWPEGLPHYVRRHSVRLPERFIQTMSDAQWVVADDLVVPCGI